MAASQPYKPPRSRRYSSDLRVVFGSYVLAAEVVDLSDDQIVVEMRKPVGLGSNVSVLGHLRAVDHRMELRVGARVEQCWKCFEGGYRVRLRLTWSDIAVHEEESLEPVCFDGG